MIISNRILSQNTVNMLKNFNSLYCSVSSLQMILVIKCFPCFSSVFLVVTR